MSIAIATFDHIVLCVKDVVATCAFYEKHPDMAAREERPGKYSIHFGYNKISLQDEGTVPAIARNTLPGSWNFCLLTDMPVVDYTAYWEREGATDRVLSVYFNDPDGNLVEVSNIMGDAN